MKKINFKPLWIALGLLLLMLSPFLVFNLVSNVYQLIYHKSFLSVLAPLALPSKNHDLKDIYTSIFDEDMGKIRDFHGTVPIDGPRVRSVHYYVFSFICPDNLQPGSGIKTQVQLKDYWKQLSPQQIPAVILTKFSELHNKIGDVIRCECLSSPQKYECWFSQDAGPDYFCGTWVIQDLQTHTYYVMYRYDPYS